MYNKFYEIKIEMGEKKKLVLRHGTVSYCLFHGSQNSAVSL